MHEMLGIKSINETDDDSVQPFIQKPVVKKDKRYSYEIEEYDEEDFFKRDSTAEYSRSVVSAEEIFKTVGTQDYKHQTDFFSSFPIINAKDEKKVNEAYTTGQNELKGFIIENDNDDYVLVNHDNSGNVYENSIKFERTFDRFIIETSDPTAYNIVQNVPHGDRYKYMLQSKELKYILEFKQTCGKNCYIKMDNNDYLLKV